MADSWKFDEQRPGHGCDSFAKTTKKQISVLDKIKLEDPPRPSVFTRCKSTEKEAEFAKCEAIRMDMRILGMKYGQIKKMP